MDAHQHGFLRIDFTLDHGNMQKTVHVILIDNGFKIAGKYGRNLGFGCSADE